MLLICAVPECKTDCEQDGNGWEQNSIHLQRQMFSQAEMKASLQVEWISVLIDYHIQDQKVMITGSVKGPHFIVNFVFLMVYGLVA